MNMAELLEVIGQIERILSGFGHPEKAAWMSERAAILRARASSDEEVERVRGELHSSVLGMGGLFDLPLEPSTSGDASAARDALDTLSDQLYELTR